MPVAFEHFSFVGKRYCDASLCYGHLEASDRDGKASRFTLQDEHLAEDLDAAGTTAKLVVTISGKQYTGTIDHAHDHEGHDHEHK
jgi:hypothetical protein